MPLIECHVVYLRVIKRKEKKTNEGSSVFAREHGGAEGNEAKSFEYHTVLMFELHFQSSSRRDLLRMDMSRGIDL